MDRESTESFNARERSLVERFVADDHDAFAQLYRLHAGSLVRFLRRRTSHEFADDAAAETFELLYRNRANFEWRPGGLRKWLFIAGRRRIAAAKRRRSASEQPAERLDDRPDRGNVEESAFGNLGDSNLDRSLAALPEPTRLVLELRYFHDFSPTEVAEVLRIQPATERQRAARGLAALRDLLAQSQMTNDDVAN